MTPAENRQKLRSILAGDACIRPASVFDPATARIAGDLGYEAAMFAGSVASWVILAAPDEVLITLTEFVEQAHRICRAAELPVLVDADHGYGNALNVRRTVEELETAGIAGLTIEDTRLPRGFGPGGKSELIPLAEGVGKMKAALAARRDPGLVILGRTSAPGITGLADAIERCKAYRDAGVDAVFVNGVKNLDDLATLCREVGLPVMIGNSGQSFDDTEALAKVGVRIALSGHLTYMAALHAARETLKALRDGVPPATLARTLSPGLLDEALRSESYKAAFRDYLGAG